MRYEYTLSGKSQEKSWVLLSLPIAESIKWCEDNLGVEGVRWSYLGLGRFSFKYKDDLIWFKMTCC